MKKILLLRHARVDIFNSQTMSASKLKDWVKKYNKAKIHMDKLPDIATLEKIRNVDMVFTSTLSRTIDTAKLLELTMYESHAVFNEAKIPDANIPLLKLNPKNWLVLLCLFLFAGMGQQDTSLQASKAQAKKAVQLLLKAMQQHDSVALIGHGGMNWLIRQELRRQGWQLESRPSNKNLGLTELALKKSAI